jgi:beta-glucosidase
LTSLLKDELNFQGQVVPDATAVDNAWAAINAGLDSSVRTRHALRRLCRSCFCTTKSPQIDVKGNADFLTLQSGATGADIAAAIKNGTISEAKIRESARRILAAQLNIAVPPASLPSLQLTAMENVRDPATKNTIRDVGARSIVLLKNTANALPLRNPKNIGVYGLNAVNQGAGPTWNLDGKSFL